LIHSLQVKPPSSFTPEETEYLTKRIQDGGTEVVQVIFFSSFSFLGARGIAILAVIRPPFQAFC